LLFQKEGGLIDLDQGHSLLLLLIARRVRLRRKWGMPGFWFGVGFSLRICNFVRKEVLNIYYYISVVILIMFGEIDLGSVW